MVFKPLLLTLLLAGISWADTGFTSTIRIGETDNSPSCVVGMIQVSTGSLTCHGQVATLTTSGGGGTSTNGGSFPAFILTDSLSARWSVTVDTLGHLVTNKLTSGPTGALVLNTVVLADASGIFWTVTINTVGDLITNVNGVHTNSFNLIPLVDSSGVTWITTAMTTGDLITN